MTGHCQNCGHDKEVHTDSDSWAPSTGDGDEVWTNDACLTCGRDSVMGTFKCFHFEV